MKILEFEVRGIVPPRNVTKPSMWKNETEVPRVIELRKKAFECFKGKTPFSKNIKMTIEIFIPKDYNEPGDLDNFIKGIFDCLSKPKDALNHPDFILHEKFILPENYDIHPERFTVIEDDEAIIEVKAKKLFEDTEEPYYRIKIEGS